MNFEEIKEKMNAENHSIQVPKNLKDISSRMPIKKVRARMKGELLTQLLCILLFFILPSSMNLHRLPRNVYYLLMFVTSLITLGYLAKMFWFLRKTKHLDSTAKEAVINFTYDLKLTLEVYKTAIMAGSLILPLAFASLILGLDFVDEKMFNQVLLLNIADSTIILSIIIYLAISVGIYFVTALWSDKLYGIHIRTLENTLKEFKIDD
ncbi:hypothetical protein ACH3O9_00895 [Leeuwenhoekiella sp. A16]|uniref:hypothetical protein n=1 Tax=Leeuwenhoekiella sp. A16 TaxID=3141462 RepID=UPI003A812174